MTNVSRLPVISPVRVPVSSSSGQLEALTQVCVDDVLRAFGLGWLGPGRSVLERALRIPARRLALRVLIYDRIVGEAGLGSGGRWALKRMARGAEISGQENVPCEGPLLVVSNHPGLADAAALFSAIPREDLRVVAAKRPFLEALPNTSLYLLTVGDNSSGNLGLVREVTRHLRRGGALLTFPAGRIEPDPAVRPGAVEALDHWSASVELFARLIPKLTIVPALVSGVISPAALRNPLTYLRRRRSDREWLAATLQMLMPALHEVRVKVMFGSHIRSGAGRSVSEAVLDEMRHLIEVLGVG